MENWVLVVGLRLDHWCGWDTDELVLVLLWGGGGVRRGYGWWGWTGGSVSHCRCW